MKILVIEDNLVTRLAVKSQLENPGNEIPVGRSPYVVTAVASQDEAEAVLARETFDYAFIDLKLGHDRHAGIDLLKAIVRSHPGTICIMMTSNNADEAVESCLRNGAADYIFKPFEERIVHDIMRKARIVHRLWSQNRHLKRETSRNGLEYIELKSKSPAFNRVLEQARKLKGKQNLAVFISGESGVGKEVLAKYLWSLENDETRMFVPVHTGAIPDSLVEAELFGSKKGAFTGSTENRLGKFEAANGGDVFLDEVATMPTAVQVKLLRVLQEREIVPVGESHPRKIDVRVISATNESLEDLVRQKRFREDLYFRLKGVTLEIPPLRERMEDLEDLIAAILRRIGMSHKTLADDAWQLCRTYRWPGNIRELDNAIKVAAELSETDEIRAIEIQPQLQERITPSPDQHTITERGGSPYGLSDQEFECGFKALVSDFERAVILKALDRHKNVSSTAKYLKIPRQTLESRIQSLGIQIK